MRKSAKERLLELADPALAALSKIVQDDQADDAVRLRASLGILDRIGLGPGATLTVQSTPWDDLISELASNHVELDRALDAPALASGGEDYAWEDAHQHGVDAQAEAWCDLDAEDERPYTTRLNRFGSNVVRGEVVTDDVGLFPPPPGPGAMQDMGGESYPDRSGAPTDRDDADPPGYGGA